MTALVEKLTAGQLVLLLVLFICVAGITVTSVAYSITGIWRKDAGASADAEPAKLEGRNENA